LVDLAALGERLSRLRQWKRYSLKDVAARAGVDVMVISRLERQQKPRLEIETAARLARVFGWTLDQFCGLVDAPAIPVVAPALPYSPLDDGKPAWLHPAPHTLLDECRLLAHIIVWHERGASFRSLADILATWEMPSKRRDGRWDPVAVSNYRPFNTPGFRTLKDQRAFVKRYGPDATASPQ
jgi:transcriptional regulator with XRE-family HTH domain